MDRWTTIPLGPWPGTDRELLRKESHLLERYDPELERDLLFVGASRYISIPPGHPDPFGAWQQFVAETPGWSFGALSYDLKNAVEDLASRDNGTGGFPLLVWAVPRFVLELSAGEALLHAPRESTDDLEKEARRLCGVPLSGLRTRTLVWQELTDKATYMSRAKLLLDHVRRGDIYEVNYCTERRADGNGWDPFRAWEGMLRKGRAPHSAFLRLGDHFALCASPERFLRFTGRHVVAEPMKGTRPRHPDPDTDLALAEELRTNEKERSENVMAVDVMRNDLARVAAPGTVHVEELFGVQSHSKVHQLVSKVVAEVRGDAGSMDVVRAAWPMASMTGAPKLRAMQLIDEAEEMGRGLFSGSIGWFGPEGTGDLNVVIRTVIFDAKACQCSLSTGSALTALCDLEQEWEECQLKARSVIEALEG